MPRKKQKIEEEILNEKETQEEQTANNQELVEDKDIELIAKQENAISEVKLEEIEEEIKKQTTISEERKKKIYKKIFKNIIIAITIIVYFIFVNLGYKKLEPSTYLIDQQVFSLITLGITILIFEKAYKKDNDELAIFGIESLVLSIFTLMTIFLVTNYQEKYTYAITTASMFFAIYYVAKSIVIYCKMKNKALKRTSDIRKIGRIKE